MENLEHGCRIQVFDATDEETSKVMYEEFALESRRVEIHVVMREDDLNVGFVFHRRLSVIPTEVSLAKFAEDPGQILSVVEYGTGIEEYEASHGLARNRLEEVLQEMGLKVIKAESIGFVKDSPSLGGIAHELFAVMVGRESSGEYPEKTEEIYHVKFFPPEAVRNVQTICGLTQAALWRFRSWGLSQSISSFWYKVAVRL